MFVRHYIFRCTIQDHLQNGVNHERLVWLLWCFVLPQVYPTGPEGFIRPGYWLFAGMGVLFALITWVIKREV